MPTSPNQNYIPHNGEAETFSRAVFLREILCPQPNVDVIL